MCCSLRRELTIRSWELKAGLNHYAKEVSLENFLLDQLIKSLH